MAAPRKYPDELRERAIRLALDLVEGPEKLSVNAACKRVGEQLAIVPDSLRNWVQQARIDAGSAPGLTTDERARLVELERENRELRRANAILKSASAFFAAELDRPSQADRLHRPASSGVRSRADLPRAH
ncbi:transposase [Geodermatophilus sp. CPCC 205761]|uniref:transposase n=1 Tax=Geodermatophilus sp. CPCC 205761 TaxID=2936597 RepID=UPI003EE88E8B